MTDEENSLKDITCKQLFRLYMRGDHDSCFIDFVDFYQCILHLEHLGHIDISPPLNDDEDPLSTFLDRTVSLTPLSIAAIADFMDN